MERKFFVAMMLMLMSSVVLYGGISGNPKFAVIRNGDVVKVIYESDQVVSARVVIVDDDGYTVHSENLRGNNGFIRPYNFSQLPYGKYTIQLIESENHFEESVDYNYQPARAENKKENDLTVHVSRIDEGDERKYLVAVPNNQANPVDEITITITDSNNKLYCTTEKISDEGFAKIFRIEAVSPEEAITFQLRNGKGARKIISKY